MQDVTELTKIVKQELAQKMQQSDMTLERARDDLRTKYEQDQAHQKAYLIALEHAYEEKLAQQAQQQQVTAQSPASVADLRGDHEQRVANNNDKQFSELEALAKDYAAVATKLFFASIQAIDHSLHKDSKSDTQPQNTQQPAPAGAGQSTMVKREGANKPTAPMSQNEFQQAFAELIMLAIKIFIAVMKMIAPLFTNQQKPANQEQSTNQPAPATEPPKAITNDAASKPLELMPVSPRFAQIKAQHADTLNQDQKMLMQSTASNEPVSETRMVKSS